MLIPSIDLMGGRVVQLRQGRELKLAFDNVEEWIERFRRYPLVQLIDLDAAMRQGDNTALVERIGRELPVQLGGGIRSPARARAALEAGARRVIVGSAFFGEEEGRGVVNTGFARELAEAIGAAQVVAGVDARGGQVAVQGWKQQVRLAPEEAMAELEPYCAAFLYTHVDTEGTLSGFPMERARQLRACTARQLIVAGGIREQAEIDALQAMGVDAVAGMAVYSGLLPA